MRGKRRRRFSGPWAGVVAAGVHGRHLTQVTFPLLIAPVLWFGLGQGEPTPSDVEAASAEERSPGGSASAVPDSLYDRWSGPYTLGDGRFLVLTDLVDQMPGGSHQLMVVEHASGWVRTLDPEEGEPGEFHVGAGFFQAAPVEGRIRFVTGPSWDADSIVVTDSSGDQVTGVRTPLRRREIAFESDGVTFAGMVILPPDTAAGPYPALVFIHGSGPLSRRSPSQVGYQLAAGGVAAVVFDKRGTGRSGGTFRPNRVVQNARDAVAALDHARTLPELDPDRIGVYAASEGGFVIPHVFEARPDLAALICRVCSILPWSEALPTYTRRSRLEPAGVPPAEVEEALSFLEAQIEYALHRREYDEMVRRYQAGEGSTWRKALGFQAPRPNPPGAQRWDVLRDFLSADPAPVYRNLEAPILVVLGRKDPRVPAGLHAPRARTVLESGRSPAWEVWELPGANHGLMLSRSGPDGEDLAPTNYAEGFHPRLIRWARGALQAGEEAAGTESHGPLP